jgi:uncharacterized tellurite resistance protein B-like protein
VSIWKLLGLVREPAGAKTPESTDTVEAIVTELDALPPEEARFVAALAYVLSRVAFADRHISEEEIETMEILLEQFADLSEQRAAQVVTLAAERARLYGGTENYPVTRELAGITTVEQRQRILQALFAVAAGDDSISTAEDRQIRQIASELELSHRDFIAGRNAWRDKLEFLRSGDDDSN